jgi:cell wall-associated NlpC family hydrolase
MPNAVVLHPVINMHADSSADSGVVSQAIYGTNVAIVGRRPGWVHIQTADEYTGWVHAPDVLPRDPYAAGEHALEVATLFAHIYREPDVRVHAPLVTVPFETHLEATGPKTAGDKNDRDWFPVRLVDGREGWVQAGDVAQNPTPLSTTDMLALSKRFLGLPYTWGGTSSYGYDCSGFVQMLERRRGIRLPRDADQQASWSGVVPVERQSVEPGDLLYFGESAAHISHTGMYLGEGKFIAASTYQVPVIQIDDLADPHWTERLVAIRRIK